jgi:type VI secretion system protein ImpJ
MSENNKTVWSEGMFLRPQHFQQHDRYIENMLRERCGGLTPFDWGTKVVKIDSRALGMGKFALSECRGIFPDGTAFNLPEDDDLPLPIDIPSDIQDALIYLALPAHRFGAVEVDTDDNRYSLARYHAVEYEVRDYNVATNATATVTVAKLQPRLLLEKEERAGYVYIVVARVIESRTDKNIILDESYIPACVDCNANPQLRSFIKEITGLLHTRGEVLGSRASEAGRGGVAEIADFMLLQTINRVEPLFEHLQTIPALHPEQFYRLAVQLAGELATFCKTSKRPVKFFTLSA